MSSGNVSERNEWEVAFGQVADVMKMVREGNRTPGSISSAMQAVIGDHIITVQPKVTMDGDTKIYHVVANFANATEAVNACDCPVKWGYADGKMGEVPMVVQPVNQRMRIVIPGRVVYNRELPELLPNLVSPIAALGFGFKFPELQRNQPIATVWRDAQGGFWCVYLSVDGDQRSVGVNQRGPGDGWGDDVGFLVGE